MKRLFYLLLLILMGNNTIQAQRTIENPTYDFRTQGVRKITKIELMPDSTRLHMRCTYSPNWWISVGRDLTIKTSNDTETYPIISVKGTEFDKQSFTPKCGYQDFILTFGPIKQDIKEIDLVAKNWNILGIKLTEQAGEKKSSFPESIRGSWSDITGEKGWTYGFYPSYAIIGHQFWTYSKIKKTRKGYQLSLQCDDKTKELYITKKDTLLAIGENKKEQQLYTLGTKILVAGEPTDLEIDPLQSGEMVLQGFIEGYHPKANFNTGLVYANDVINRGNIQSLIKIEADGRFSTKINLAHAGQFFFTIKDQYIRFLGTPNDTLTIYFNWEGLIESDCHPNNRDYDSGHTRYMGKYGRLIRELSMLSKNTRPNIQRYYKTTKKLDLQPFYEETIKDFKKDSIRLEKLLADKNLLPLSKKLSRTDLTSNYLDLMFMYLWSAKLEHKSVVGQNYHKMYKDCSVLPKDFFHLLKYIDINDPTLLLTNSFSTLINRYEYASFFVNYGLSYGPNDILGFADKQEKLNPIEQEALSQLKQYYAKTIELDSIQEDELFKTIWKIEAKFPKEKKTLLDSLNFFCKEKEWAENDSISKTFWNTSGNVMQQIALSRNWNYLLKDIEAGYGEKITTLAKNYITIPFLKENMDKVFHQKFHAKKSNEIPEGLGKELFQKIVAPHKGKYILVDFWATSCGPCVGGIKSSHDLRTKLKDKNIAFVFITYERGSPIDAYNKIMKDVTGDKHRLNQDDYNKLAALFNINGIPRYLFLDTQGKIIDDQFNLYSLESKLKELGVIEK